jgi:TolB-like protein/Tfp pilus assembly protein PilF
MTGAHSPRAPAHFGLLEVDFKARELRRQGVRVKLQDQPFQVLQILLEHPGEVVSREELRQRIWPADTFVDFEQGLNNAIKRLREALNDSPEAPQIIETVPRRGYRFIAKLDESVHRIRSLAVLPLENLPHDPEQEYFAEGLTEALITTLAKIGELRVISRTSVMQYRGVHKPLSEIARELGVDAIVEGTVFRAGDRVRITAQLIDTPVETHLWAESYERDMRDILALQSEVAQAIAREIRVKLTPVDEARLAKAHPVDPQAYEAYLKGRYYWNRRSAAGLGQAVQSFEEAIARDPTYAAAYAGLADCFSVLGAWGFVPADQGCDKAKELALRALDIDHGLADAHASLAFATTYQFDFLAAEREFERSIELNPRYASAHEWFGLLLGHLGRYDEACTELKRAIRLDPLSSIMHVMLATVYLYARRYDRAVEECTKTIDVDPDFSPGHATLGWAYTCKSLYDSAISELRKAVELSFGNPSFVAWLGAAYAAAGQRDEAHKILEQLDQRSQREYVTSYGVARVYATLGQNEEALHWLETAYRQRAEWLILLKNDPCFDDLRSEPRFQDLMQRMNFPG